MEELFKGGDKDLIFRVQATENERKGYGAASEKTILGRNWLQDRRSKTIRNCFTENYNTKEEKKYNLNYALGKDGRLLTEENEVCSEERVCSEVLSEESYAERCKEYFWCL